MRWDAWGELHWKAVWLRVSPCVCLSRTDGFSVVHTWMSTDLQKKKKSFELGSLCYLDKIFCVESWTDTNLYSSLCLLWKVIYKHTSIHYPSCLYSRGSRTCQSLSQLSCSEGYTQSQGTNRPFTPTFTLMDKLVFNQYTMYGFFSTWEETSVTHGYREEMQTPHRKVGTHIRTHDLCTGIQMC